METWRKILCRPSCRLTTNSAIPGVHFPCHGASVSGPTLQYAVMGRAEARFPSEVYLDILASTARNRRGAIPRPLCRCVPPRSPKGPTPPPSTLALPRPICENATQAAQEQGPEGLTVLACSLPRPNPSRGPIPNRNGVRQAVVGQSHRALYPPPSPSTAPFSASLSRSAPFADLLPFLHLAPLSQSLVLLPAPSFLFPPSEPARHVLSFQAIPAAPFFEKPDDPRIPPLL